MKLLWCLLLPIALSTPVQAGQLFCDQFNFSGTNWDKYVVSQNGITPLLVNGANPFFCLQNTTPYTMGEVIWHYDPGFTITSAILNFFYKTDVDSFISVCVSTDNSAWRQVASIDGGSSTGPGWPGHSIISQDILDLSKYVKNYTDVYVKLDMGTSPNYINEFAVSYNGAGYSIEINNSQPVPEPSTYIMAIILLICIIIMRRM